ncbi:MAG: hypothetical protein KJ626_09115 [Verrucomicrobia bacterium]|nr:hypothetical protein [Verrucomicrobiota bacterium]
MMSKRIAVVVKLFVVTVALALLNGCVGYRLGSMLPADIRTVYVPTFANETDEPLLEVDTTRATISRIQRDGSLKIADAETADAILKVRLIAYDLAPLSYDGDKKTLVNEYRAVLTTSVVLVRRTTNKVLAEDPSVQGETTFEFGGDLTSAKRQALPEASEDLAHDIVERIVEAW